MLRVVAELLRRGISPRRLKSAFQALRRHHAEITATSLPANYLVTDGRKVFLRHDGTTIEALDDDGQMAFAFVIELSAIRDSVTEIARAKRIPIGEAA